MKHKAKMAGEPYKAGRDDTFVTGGGLPGQRRQRIEEESDEEEPKPVFDSLEDELMNKVNGYE